MRGRQSKFTTFGRNPIILAPIMKNLVILVTCLIMLVLHASGQDQQIITVKAGTRAIDYFPQDAQYRYPNFIQGKVVFKDGTSTVTRLNYCILVGEMQFLANGDTMAVANEKTIRYVQIMQDTFFYDNGYLEVLAGKAPSIMAVKNYVKLKDIKKEGPMGTRSSTNNAQTYGGIYDIGVMDNFNLVQQEDMVLSKNTEYYIGNELAGFTLYKKANLMKLLPQHKDDIENYLKQNNCDFKAKEDLLKLTAYLQNLQ